MIALLKKKEPEANVRETCEEQLEAFLGKGTSQIFTPILILYHQFQISETLKFVEMLFETIHSGSYLPSGYVRAPKEAAAESKKSSRTKDKEKSRKKEKKEKETSSKEKTKEKESTPRSSSRRDRHERKEGDSDKRNRSPTTEKRSERKRKSEHAETAEV